MHRNSVWLIFLSIIGVSVLIYTGSTLVELYNYIRLQTDFPLKSSLYTVTLWSILAYFIWLGYYVARKAN